MEPTRRAVSCCCGRRPGQTSPTAFRPLAPKPLPVSANRRSSAMEAAGSPQAALRSSPMETMRLPSIVRMREGRAPCRRDRGGRLRSGGLWGLLLLALQLGHALAVEADEVDRVDA